MIAPQNVRALHPMRVLLVTDDERFATSVAVAAALQRVPLAHVRTADDLDAIAAQHKPNVVVFDARGAPRRISRCASAYATLHPRAAVVLVTNDSRVRTVSGLRLVPKRTAERLLDELELAYLGVVA